MLVNLLRELVGRAGPVPGPTNSIPVLAEFEPLRAKLHSSLREGRVVDALNSMTPVFVAATVAPEIRTLLEFSIRTVAALGEKEQWRHELAYWLGRILLALGDEIGAGLCMAIAWPGDTSAQHRPHDYQTFRRGPGIFEFCRTAGHAAVQYEEILVERMDGRISAELDVEPAFLCMLPGGRVLGQSFLPAAQDGTVFVERCTDSPGKLERLDGITQLDSLRLASSSVLWASGRFTPRRPGRHLLIGNHDNIGHWLLFYFTRLRLLEEMPALRDANVVVGANVRPLHLECLQRAGFADERVVRVQAGEFAEFEELWVPSFVCGISASQPVYWLPDVVRFLRRSLGVSPPRGGGKRLIFLSRRGAKWRRLLNEDEIAGVLAGMGFEEVDPAALDLQGQIDLAAQAGAIVATAGAAINLHLFAGEGVPVVQLQMERNLRMNMHVQLTRVLGQPFHAVVGTVPARDADPLKSDFRVSPEDVRAAVAKALTG